MIRWTNRHDIPAAIEHAVRSRNKTRLGRYSVTQLIGPPRIRRLLEQHDVTCDVSDEIWSLLGSGVHRAIEATGESAPRQDGETRDLEVEFCATIEDTLVSATLDELTTREHLDGSVLLATIRDWKTSSVSSWRDGVRPEWVCQLNSYEWVLRNAHTFRPAGWKVGPFDHAVCVEVESLRVTKIYRDWSRARAEASAPGAYPPCPIETIEVPRWSREVQHEFVRARVAMHIAADRIVSPELPAICSPNERWRTEDRFAVMKPGGKRAVRVFDSHDEAITFIGQSKDVATLTIQKRPGQDVRCAHYCQARTVCPHGIQVASEMRAAGMPAESSDA